MLKIVDCSPNFLLNWTTKSMLPLIGLTYNTSFLKKKQIRIFSYGHPLTHMVWRTCSLPLKALPSGKIQLKLNVKNYHNNA